MLKTDTLARVATAAVGALVLSTLSVAAAVGPGHVPAPVASGYAQVHNAGQAHG